MSTTAPAPTGNPWAFVAVVGAASLATVWAVRRAGGLAAALTAAAAPALDRLDDEEPAGAPYDYAAADELGDELGADEPDEEPPARGSAVDSW